MSDAPLLTDQLPKLLALFPDAVLRALLDQMQGFTSYSPFPDRRANMARAVPEGGNLRKHARQIAKEVIWWGSHDLRLLFSSPPTWQDVLKDVAGAIKAEFPQAAPAWRIEEAILGIALANWNAMTREQQEEALRQAGANLGAAAGGGFAAAGGTMAAMEAAAAFLAPRGAAALAAAAPFAAVLAPVATALGTGMTLYSLAGPSQRVVRPVAVSIALTRRILRDLDLASSFKD